MKLDHAKRTTLAAISLLLLLFITVTIIGVMITYHTVQDEIGSLNENTKPITQTTVNKKLDGKRVVFYRSTCPTCKRTIPFVYIANKLSGANVVYLDTFNVNNRRFAQQSQVKDVPSAVRINSLQKGFRIAEGNDYKDLISAESKVTLTFIIVLVFIAECVAAFKIVFWIRGKGQLE